MKLLFIYFDVQSFLQSECSLS